MTVCPVDDRFVGLLTFVQDERCMETVLGSTTMSTRTPRRPDYSSLVFYQLVSSE